MTTERRQLTDTDAATFLYRGKSKMDWDAPLHLKRLARELNANGWQRSRAFYCDQGKFNQARFSKGALQVRMCRGPWLTVEGETHFDDGSGNEIVAARFA